VDEVFQMVTARGLYIGFLPTWVDKISHLGGSGSVSFNPENAYIYGKWLGNRCRQQTNLIWILGGDRPALIGDEDDRPIWRAMAVRIDAGVSGPALMTYHPSGGSSSSEWIHDKPWLDVNMIQSSHGFGHDTLVWAKILADYTRLPTKPTLDG
jgi:hypothetical protein